MKRYVSSDLLVLEFTLTPLQNARMDSIHHSPNTFTKMDDPAKLEGHSPYRTTEICLHYRIHRAAGSWRSA